MLNQRLYTFLEGLQEIFDKCASETEGKCDSEELGESDLEIQPIDGGKWNAILTWFDLYFGDALSLSALKGEANALSSFGIAVYYLDELPISQERPVQLRAEYDWTQFFFWSRPVPSAPRTAVVPRWHFTMLHDMARNCFYHDSIQHAIRREMDRGKRPQVLDIGGGSGLLSMLAVQAGAHHVVSAEASRHLCDMGEEIVCLNGYYQCITFLEGDVQAMRACDSDDIRRGLKPDGNLPDLDKRVSASISQKVKA